MLISTFIFKLAKHSASYSLPWTGSNTSDFGHADMHSLKTDHPDTSRELEEGNISVTKSTIPFVSIGAGHACEQLNRLMKVHAGLIGI